MMSGSKLASLRQHDVTCGNRRSQVSRPMIRGVLNITPDSFSDGGESLDPEVAVQQAKKLFDAGADIIDVGGESTRPGAKQVPLSLERSRVIPVIKELSRLDIPVSIDTQKPELMQEAIESGACLVNDVSGAKTPEVASLVVEQGVGICVMHMQGSVRDIQNDPSYRNVVEEGVDLFNKNVAALVGERGT